MIIIIPKFQVHKQIVILHQVIIKEINQYIHPVLVKAILILLKIMLSMLKITHWLINLQSDMIQLIAHPINKMIGGTTQILIILMDTKAKIQHIFIMTLMLTMFLTLVNISLIVVINHNLKMDLNIQTVIITLLLVKLTVFKLLMIIQQIPILMLLSINIILLIKIIMDNHILMDHHQLKI